MPRSLFGRMMTALGQSTGRLTEGRWEEIPLIGLSVSILYTFLVVVVTALFFGMATITAGLVVSFWSAVLVIALVLTAINYFSVLGGAPMPASTVPPE